MYEKLTRMFIIAINTKTLSVLGIIVSVLAI